MDNENLFKMILDGSSQMIQVSDAETHEMLYANETALKFANRGDLPYKGQPCFAYMMGFDAPCPYCPLNDMHGEQMAVSEVDNGEQIFAVKTQYIDLNGRKAFIEYAWDVTSERRSLKIFEAQKRTLMQ